MRMRVPSGFLLAVCFGLLSRPDPTSMIAGGILCLLGLALRAWAAGHLAKNRELADGGPYAWTRNPLYLGTLVAALGLAVAARSWWILGVTASVFLLVYIPVIEQEEAHLVKLFPGYADYAQRVPLLWPEWPKQRGKSCFSWSQYFHNEEWKAGTAFLAGMGYLLWKM